MSDGVDTTGTEPGVDKGAERDARPAKPCALRGTNLQANGVAEHAWCIKPDGHEGSCNGFFSTAPAPSGLDKGKSK